MPMVPEEISGPGPEIVSSARFTAYLGLSLLETAFSHQRFYSDEKLYPDLRPAYKSDDGDGPPPVKLYQGQ
jgi:hypothetical protein